MKRSQKIITDEGSDPKSQNTIRVGVLVPSSNVALEPELYSLASHLRGVTIHFARVPVTKITLDQSDSNQFTIQPMIDAGKLLCDAGVDVIVWGGTSGSWLGLEHDYKLVDELQKALKVPATTASLGLINACHAFGVKRVSIVTPYISQVNAAIEARYRDEEIDVISTASLGITRNRDFGDVGHEDIISLIRKSNTDKTEAILVVCTNLRATSLVAQMELSLGIPVFDSIGVTLLTAIRTAGSSMTIPNSGALMAQGCLRTDLQLLSKHLLALTSADRVTIRVDIAPLNIDVNLPVAEATLPHVKRISSDSTLDQRALSTIKWLEEFRIPLIQRLFDGEPRPPLALEQTYGVKAQMLAPIEYNEKLIGWVSVHSLVEREWSSNDQFALQNAARQALLLIVKTI